jgi:hypothetical protein
MKVKVLVVAGLAVFLAIATFLSVDMISELYVNRVPPCDKLPSEEVVRSVLTQHPDLVEKIQCAGAYSIDVEHPENCKEKAYIVIQYDVAPTESRIRKVIGPTFYGVPYWMQNI